MAVDHFFEGGSRKRKRGGGGAPSSGGRGKANGAGGARGRGGGFRGSQRGRGSSSRGTTERSNGGVNGVQGSDEELEGSDSDDDGSDVADGDDGAEPDSDDEAEALETPAQKRLRLAQQYLDSLKAGQDGQSVDERGLTLGKLTEICIVQQSWTDRTLDSWRETSSPRDCRKTWSAQFAIQSWLLRPI